MFWGVLQQCIFKNIDKMSIWKGEIIIYDYYDEESYYEPTPADEIFFEAKEKLENCLKETIKNRIQLLEEENKKLKEENSEFKIKIREVKSKERQLEIKERDLENSVLRKKFSEMLKPLEKQYTIYAVDYGYKWIEKCDKCDEDRKIKFVSPLGRELKENCECSRNFKVWKPKELNIKALSLYKNKKTYPYSISVTPKYDSPSYADMYCKFELQEFIENLNNLEFNFEDFKYNDIGFKTKEDCQKYCDFLNDKEKKDVPKKYWEEIYN